MRAVRGRRGAFIASPGFSAAVVRFALLLVAAVGAGRAVGAIVYVDRSATGMGTGVDWAHARVSLQDALGAAQAGDVIHVAAGVYRPDVGLDRQRGDAGASFALKEGVQVLGGFPAGGGTLEQRDPQVHETILSGDLNGDDPVWDGPPAGDWHEHPARSDNSLHVVTATGVGGSAVLDGFAITGGCARSEDALAASGGGLLALGASPVLRDCTFRGNSASFGAAAAFVAPGPTAALIEGCVFLANGTAAGGEGGAVMNNSSVVTVRRSAFYGNGAHWGGGVDCTSGSLTVADSAFSGNQAAFGGAINCNNSLSVTITNCTFLSNLATEYGGAVRNESSEITLRNSILWGSSALRAGPQVAVLGEGATEVAFSNVMDGHQGVFIENGASLDYDEASNVSEDPLFADPNGLDGVSGTGDDDWRLREGSPCVDAGRSSDVAAESVLDLDGRPRITDIPAVRNGGLGPGPIVDMGAHEFLFAGDVDADGVVGLQDLGAMGARWGRVCGSDRDCRASDLVRDGRIDLADLLVLSEQWLKGS